MRNHSSKVFFYFLCLGFVCAEQGHAPQSKSTVGHEKGNAESTLPIIQGCKDPTVLEKWFAEKSLETNLSGISVMYKGQVVLEGPQAQKPAKVWSASKSISSLLAGFFLDESQLDNPVAADYPAISKSYPKLTYRQLMNMTSGYDAIGGKAQTDKRAPEHIRDNSQYPLQADAPLFEPGTQFAYWTDSYRLLGHLIEAKAKEQSSKQKTLQQLFRDKIAIPSGVELSSWARLHDAAGERTLSDAGGGIEISASNMSKLGHEILNAYHEKPKALFRPSWIKALTTLEVPHDAKLYEYNTKNYDGRGAYGLGWWLNTPHPQTQERAWPDLSPTAFAAKGVHQNLLLIDPAEEFVFSRANLDLNPVKALQPNNEWINSMGGSLLHAVKKCMGDANAEKPKEEVSPMKDEGLFEKLRSFFQN